MALVGRNVEGSAPIVVLLVDRLIPSVGKEGVDDVEVAKAGRPVDGSFPIDVLFVARSVHPV